MLIPELAEIIFITNSGLDTAYELGPVVLMSTDLLRTTLFFQMVSFKPEIRLVLHCQFLTYVNYKLFFQKVYFCWFLALC